MRIRIDHKLRVARSQLPPEILELIVEALSIPNVQRQRAMEQNIWGWQDLPETIALYEWSARGGHLLMPRGFARNLMMGLRDMDVTIEVQDDRTFENDLPAIGNEISLRPWQKPAVAAIIDYEQGMWKAPAGSGKTVAVLEAIRRLNCPSLVLVNTKDILYQWEDRAHEFLGEDFPVGLIGDGKFQISDYLTVATVQTLHKRMQSLEEEGFFEQFSFLCLDECHHATADTYNTLVNRFSSRYRIGVSATPDKTGDFALAENVLGPIFHETMREDVDSLVKPTVFKIATKFDFAYRGTEGRRRSNYPHLVACLTNDIFRNTLIAKSILIEHAHHSLVISQRIKHLEAIAKQLERIGYPNMILMLTGNESAEQRQKIIEHASKYPCAIFSTLADEALDIPRLDRLFLTFPQRNPGLVEQQVGRICRSHPDKTEALVFDFADLKVGPCEAQWKVRRLQVYQPHGYNVIPVHPDSILDLDYEISEINDYEEYE